MHTYTVADLLAQQTAPSGGFHLELWLAVNREVNRRIGVE